MTTSKGGGDHGHSFKHEKDDIFNIVRNLPLLGNERLSLLSSRKDQTNQISIMYRPLSFFFSL